jgi:hypothetical protein
MEKTGEYIMQKISGNIFIYFIIIFLVATCMTYNFISPSTAAAERFGWSKPTDYDKVYAPTKLRSALGCIYCTVKDIETYNLLNPLNYKKWKKFNLFFCAPKIEEDWSYKCTRTEENKYTCERTSDTYNGVYKFEIPYEFNLELEPKTENAKSKVCSRAFDKNDNFNFPE